jgi:chromosome segregation ATPase
MKTRITLNFAEQTKIREYIIANRERLETTKGMTRQDLADECTRLLNRPVTIGNLRSIEPSIEPPLNIRTQESRGYAPSREQIEKLREEVVQDISELSKSVTLIEERLTVQESSLKEIQLEFSDRMRKFDEALSVLSSLESEWKRAASRIAEVSRAVQDTQTQVSRIITTIDKARVVSAINDVIEEQTRFSDIKAVKGEELGKAVIVPTNGKK